MASGSTSPVADVPTRVRGYRPELQGLRALAATLVVIYHVWFGRISGGVDVFFLISGFLITGQLFRASSRGRIQLRPMWGRMIKRLFPAALTVLLATMAASVLILPEDRWFQTIHEIIASALYVENWQLAADSVDYFARHNAASVVQHFWSLSIQGQFYLTWPLLVLVVAFVARRARCMLRSSLALTLTAVFAASLAYSVYLTAANQPLAYFHSLTRAWEFALGGLLALCVDAVLLPRQLRVVLGWVGVVGLVSCGMVLQVGTVFPGYIALWPTLSAAFVIVAGATGSGAGADRLLSSRPLEYLGNLSYALYLWHWPVLLFFLLVTKRGEAGLAGGVLVIGVALGLSVLTYHLVETPVRDSRIGVRTNWGAYRFGVLALVPVLLAAGAWQALSTQRADYLISLGDPSHPGAQSRTPGFRYHGVANASLVPPQVALSEDWARIADCSPSRRNDDLLICSTNTTGPPEKQVVVVGDSHSQQYVGAFLPIARQRNWRISTMLRGACPFSTNADAAPGDEECVEWNAAAVEEINELHPDAVVTLASRNVRVGLTESTPTGFVEQWRKVDQSIPVLALRDYPRYEHSPSGCVEANGRDVPECSTQRADLLAEEPPYQRIPGVPPNVSFLDLSDYFCTESVCPPTIGNVLVYLDNNHPSATYMATLAPTMYRRITAELGW
ncbi:MAG: acyltransferase family protein [Sciscionella sp.]